MFNKFFQIGVVLLLCSWCQAAIAQTAVANQQRTSCSQIPVNNNLIRFLKSKEEITHGYFQQIKTIEKYNVELHSSGHFRMQENVLEWNTTEPQMSEIEISASSVKSKTGNNVYVTPLEKGSMGMLLTQTFFGLLRLDLSALSEHFTLNFEENDQSWLVQLFPCHAEFEVKSMVVQMFKETQKIYFKLIHANGDMTRITITST